MKRKLEMKNFSDVRDFHIKFDLPSSRSPQPMDDGVFAFRLGFMKEEFREAEVAYAERNLVGMVDALIDLVYVIYGTVLFLGDRGRENWPSFQIINGMTSGMSMHRNDVPGFLSQLINKQYMFTLQSRINAFAISHNAAVIGEPNGLELCYQNLGGAALICYTMASLMSIPWEQCWDAVHAANMRKIRAASDGSDSQRSSSWDVVKPVGWQAPDVAIMHLLIDAARRKEGA